MKRPADCHRTEMLHLDQFSVVLRIPPAEQRIEKIATRMPEDVPDRPELFGVRNDHIVSAHDRVSLSQQTETEIGILPEIDIEPQIAIGRIESPEFQKDIPPDEEIAGKKSRSLTRLKDAKRRGIHQLRSPLHRRRFRKVEIPQSTLKPAAIGNDVILGEGDDRPPGIPDSGIPRR